MNTQPAKTLPPSEFPNIGDACRHTAHIPEAPGQGVTLTTCRHRLNRPELGACPYCQPEGRGNNQ